MYVNLPILECKPGPTSPPTIIKHETRVPIGYTCPDSMETSEQTFPKYDPTSMETNEEGQVRLPNGTFTDIDNIPQCAETTCVCKQTQCSVGNSSLKLVSKK